jgi:uncharacterized protein YndB with AHSA1/START domain
MSVAADTRTIEIEMDIDAAVARVWKALTDADELRRWFPLEAEVQPGVGGSIRLRWGQGLDGRNAILSWEPENHLRSGWFDPVDPEAAALQGEGRVFHADEKARRRLVLDFYLEDHGGRTTLRMVHSGFSRAPEWDEEYNAHARGWTFELRSLRHYLERHFGAERHVGWVRRPVPEPKDRAWQRLAGAMQPGGGLDALRPGDRYTVTTTHGDRLEGKVVLNQPPTEFAGTVENRGHSLLRFGIETYGGPPEATVWLSTWGDEDRARSFEAQWDATLTELFE